LATNLSRHDSTHLSLASLADSLSRIESVLVSHAGSTNSSYVGSRQSNHIQSTARLSKRPMSKLDIFAISGTSSESSDGVHGWESSFLGRESQPRYAGRYSQDHVLRSTGRSDDGMPSLKWPPHSERQAHRGNLTGPPPNLSGNNWFDDVSDVERTLLIDSVPPRNARLRRAALHKQPTYWEALKAKTLSYIPCGGRSSGEPALPESSSRFTTADSAIANVGTYASGEEIQSALARALAQATVTSPIKIIYL
jgi:hypothetical protein